MCLQGTQQWLKSTGPFTNPITSSSSTSSALTSSQARLVSQLGSAQRGLLVIGQLAGRQEVVAGLRIAQALHWPVVADALSGIQAHTTISHPGMCPLHLWIA